MSLILKNGVVVGAANISVVIGGVVVTGIKSIDIAVNQKKDNVMGFQAQPVGRGRGQYEYPESKMDILLEEWKAIVAASPNSDPLQLPMFNIPITYTDNSGSPIMNPETMNNCEFTGVLRTYKAGDTAEWVSVGVLYAGLNQ